VPGLASRLRERVTFERYDDASAAWQPIPEPSTLWAEVVALGQEQYRLALRYRADLHNAQDAEPALRALWDGHVLDVLDVTEVERSVEVQVLAKGRQIEYDNLATGARRKTSWP
jgi:hypothetical protein